MSVDILGGGTGTKEKPFLVESATDLNELRKHIWSRDDYYNDRKYIVQVANIDMGTFGTWEPMDAVNVDYNGNDFVISNFKLRNIQGQEYYGLFGRAQDLDVYDLGIRNIDFDFNDKKDVSFIGGVSGYLVGKSTIKRCFVDGIIKHGAPAFLGGLVGMVHLETDTVKIENSYTDIFISQYKDIEDQAIVGGLVGYPTFSSDDKFMFSIVNCYASGDFFAYLRGHNGVGGIVGSPQYNQVMSEDNDILIKNTFYLGEKISLYDDYYADDESHETSIAGTIHAFYRLEEDTDKYLPNDIKVEGSYITDNFHFDIRGVNIEDPYEDHRIALFHEETGTVSREDTKRKSTYESLGWDFNGVWSIVEGSTYPSLSKSVQCVSIKL